MARDITNSADILDIRGIIERVEELRGAADLLELDSDESEELETLEYLLEELCGNGGDEQWEGNWYPLTLVRSSYFTEYAQQLAEDIGAVNFDGTWPNNCIDWDLAARELRMDYSPVKFNGVTYWYR